MPFASHSDYRVTLPSDWRDSSLIMFAGPANDGFGPTVTVGREELEQTTALEDYAENTLSMLSKTLGPNGFNVTEEGSANLAGLRAIWRRYDCALDSKPITQVQYYIMRDLIAYVVTLSDRRERFSKSYPAMRNVAESLEFI